MLEEKIISEIRSFHRRATILLSLIFLTLFLLLSGLGLGFYKLYKLYQTHKKDITAIESKIDAITHPIKNLEKPIRNITRSIEKVL